MLEPVTAIFERKEPKYQFLIERSEFAFIGECTSDTGGEFMR